MPWSNADSYTSGQILTAASLNKISDDINIFGVAWTSFTPTLSAASGGLNIGSTGIQQAYYMKFGRVICWNAYFLAQGSGIAAGTGEYRIALPAAMTGASRTDLVVANGWQYDTVTGTFASVTLDLRPSSTSARIAPGGGAGTIGSTLRPLSSGWTMTVSGIYEASAI